MRTRWAGACVLAIVTAFATTSQAEGSGTWVLEAGGARVEASDGSAASEKAGSEGGIIKKPEAGKRDEIVLRGGSALARDLAGMLGEGLTRDCPRNVNASLVAVGPDGTESARMAFAWAILTELGMPAFDGSASPAGDVTIKLEPQFPKRVFQKGAVAKPAAGPDWRRSSFKLSVDGLSPAAVKQLGELKISQAPSTTAPVTCAAPIVSDLTFAVASSEAAALAAWRDGKNGTIDYLAGDGSTLLKVRLTGLKKKSQSAEGALIKVTASIETVSVGRR